LPARCAPLLAALSLALAPEASPDGRNQPTRFSLMAPGPVEGGWRVSGLRGVRETAFRLTEQGGEVVVEARSEGSMAALVFELDPAGVQYSTIRWRWRIANHLVSANLRTRDGDDYPARLYVFFDGDLARMSLLSRIRLGMARAIHGRSLPAVAICYVWDREAAMGTVVSSAYTESVQMIVVRSGGAVPAPWLTETRDLRADYRRAFGAEPPRVSGVAIASDSDDTGESAVAWFGDVVLSDPVEDP
jgi:hypothetical protein